MASRAVRFILLGDLVAFQNSRCAPKLSCVHIPLLCQPKIRGQASASWKICQQGKALERGGNMLVFMVTLFALQGKTNFLAPLWQFPPFDRRLETCSSRPSAPHTVTPWQFPFLRNSFTASMIVNIHDFRLNSAMSISFPPRTKRYRFDDREARRLPPQLSDDNFFFIEPSVRENTTCAILSSGIQP
jgi:hypothetical protein